MVNITLNPNGFQLRCSNYLLGFAKSLQKPQTIILKAPTGSGKTVILIDFIEKYNSFNENTAFIWLSPGGGDLEEQSQKSMEEKSPQSSVKNLQELLATGFETKDIVFINWELVTKSGNKAVSKIEKQNLFDKILIAQKQNIDFIIIVDEEHSNDTRKAKDIIDAFHAFKEIRVSATAKRRSDSDYYEVPESEVISEGFISKAIYINSDIKNQDTKFDSEYTLLIDKALEKRAIIREKYLSLNKKINPLVVIQFPNSSSIMINKVETYLAGKNITYDNKLLSKWLSDEKINIDKLEQDNSDQTVLIMKQAISTGWDCPRAKILVKLRENMEENFEIQTIGRIRRMPERLHYDIEELDCCYLYTFDSKYVESVKESTKSAYNVKVVKAKEKTQSTKLLKELKDLQFVGINERKAAEAIYQYFLSTYFIDGKRNETILASKGYNISSTIDSRVLGGRFQTIDDIPKDTTTGFFFDLKYEVNTHVHGIDLLHATYSIAKSVGMEYDKLNAILYKLFRQEVLSPKYKVLKLSKKEYYAFIINNEDKLKQDFRNATTQLVRELKLNLNINTIEFSIPLNDVLKYDPTEKSNSILETNAYYNYDEQSLVEGIRSTSEILFETYCETNDKVDWVYKNGDSGDRYFSIVYLDALYRQWSFYPDYIIKLKSGKILIIETKGGESYGRDKNIDKQVKNKFFAFKDYAIKNNLEWAFVRDKNTKLFFNNTEYVNEISDSNWKKISELF